MIVNKDGSVEFPECMEIWSLVNRFVDIPNAKFAFYLKENKQLKDKEYKHTVRLSIPILYAAWLGRDLVVKRKEKIIQFKQYHETKYQIYTLPLKCTEKEFNEGAINPTLVYEEEITAVTKVRNAKLGSNFKLSLIEESYFKLGVFKQRRNINKYITDFFKAHAYLNCRSSDGEDKNYEEHLKESDDCRASIMYVIDSYINAFNSVCVNISERSASIPVADNIHQMFEDFQTCFKNLNEYPVDRVYDILDEFISMGGMEEDLYIFLHLF